ncbi:MAG: TetR/AcrR family transcriptional regulator [Myxococcaceae bacterium]
MRRTQGVLGGRSDQVVKRVLDAALAELAHSGFHAFRMDVVAREAGVNKTTIYRRWPTRADLVGALVERMRAPLRDQRLPDTGSLEGDLLEAFTLRFSMGRKVEGRAWARLLEERARPEVEALIGSAVDGRSAEWTGLVERAIKRKEVPTGTEPRLVLHLVRAIVDARRGSVKLDRAWLELAVKTVLAAAQAGVLRQR